MKKANVLHYIVTGCFAAMFLCGFVLGFTKPYNFAQAKLVISANVLGLAVLAIPYLLRLCRIDVAKYIIYMWWTFTLCHAFSGRNTYILYPR